MVLRQLSTNKNCVELDNNTEVNGCLEAMTLPPYGFKAFVPIDKWLRPSPVITKFNPGHDSRIASTNGPGQQQNLSIELYFSDEMNCEEVEKAISITSTTEDGVVPSRFRPCLGLAPNHRDGQDNMFRSNIGAKRLEVQAMFSRATLLRAIQ